ncbi:MAG: extracellular solute-binding protein [Clostridia bacterium]|nr:extracellular solute-binding protein [Clostridia bacterium]
MNKTKRFCAIALAAMTAATALAACGAQPTTSTPTASQGGSTTTTTTESTGTTEVEDPLYGEGQNGAISLKVWGPDAAQAILKEQCDTFIENMKPYAPNGITIEVVPQGEDVAATQAKTDITAAADVFGFACDNIDGLVKAGALLEVTGAEKDFVTANNSESSVAAATVDGKIYAYPETGDNSYILVYDKTVVSEEQAKTLEGTLEACKAANKKFIMDAGNGYYSCMFMFTGGLKINGLVDGVQQFTDYDEDKVAKTVVAFQSLFAEYKDTFMSGEASKVVDGFKSGTVGAGIDGSWNFSSAKSTLGDNAGFTILPTIKVGDEDLPIINMFGYKLLGVNAQSKFPNTAIELAKFLTNEECQMARAEKLNWGPSNKVVAESDLIKNDAALSAILAQSANSVPQTGLAGTFWTPVGTLGSKIIDFDNMMDEAAAKELINKTIANVKDE